MGHPLLLVQLLVILLVSRAVSWLLRYLGQPAVIGEMIAGLVMGPMVFGALAPDAQAALFPKESLSSLNSLSTLGLVLFMLVVGAELRLPGGLKAQLKTAGWIGGLAVLLPMILGFAAAPLLYDGFAPAGVGFFPFAAFMATAGAITALPVMARILKDRNLTDSLPGRLGIGAAALADALAWLLLAVVVALISAHGDWMPFWRTAIGLVALTVIAFGIIRPLSQRLLDRHAPDGKPDRAVLAFLLIGALAFAAATEWLNLHAVFGAFVFGLSLPRDDRLLKSLIERIEYVAIVALLPVFFVLAGLSTTAHMSGADAGIALLLVLGVAIIGKLVGGTAGARISGLSWRNSFAVGSLMNARGLMELIVMKVGLDAGVIDQRMFTLLLIMAIVTTMMTTPMVLAFTRSRKDATEVSSYGHKLRDQE
ncbi:cation:proton antiporter [Luteibacter aegosomaticola]|uniref:cation:proton antiporter n=1 Tax=Luteibacter aegosomaticola TaxID=2911538 RepID=UPI001FF8925A|nr:cation:proton antiporter [Luteibacter aegosomaticola]UPG90588.1 cation:proton antiporter [Luteibacter aegosomaticola]